MGHVKMMSAVQPFLSGAISKTINMPQEATVEDVEQMHMDSWKLGLKAVAIYRDGSKVGQPLSDKKAKEEPETKVIEKVVRSNERRDMPRVRNSKTIEFRVSDLHGYVTVGEFEDGTPGELFVTVAKMGSTLAGLMDAFGRSLSYGLQYGVPFKAYVRGMVNTNFAPFGMTDDPEVKTATSIIDYIFRRLAIEYLSIDDRLELGLASLDELEAELESNQASLLDGTDDAKREDRTMAVAEVAPSGLDAKESTEATYRTARAGLKVADAESPLCSNCGNVTQRAGSCYVCTTCGSTTGCS
jgi:ribonucleoside-diphosphate reductase alpha chain